MSDTGWHTRSASQVLDDLGVTPDGLGAAEAAHRLSAAGANVIPQKRGRSLAGMVVAQFADFMIVVLLAAALISGLIGEAADTIAILVIVVLNALVGATQEFRAERAVAALRKMSAPEARVVRDGGLVTIAAAELVPGDIVVLEAGNIVPADLRLVTSDELQADESMLTGESEPVGKRDAVVETEDAVIGDRVNMLFKSSLVTRGGGRGVVVATGAETEIGRIATLLSTSEGVKTPLQRRLTRFGRYLALVVLGICVVVFAAGLMQGQPVLLMFLTSVSMAVAAIPEALPAVVTVSLALGAHKLIRHRALVRNLPAVETLGSVTVICADKTGTLTENRMRVERFDDGMREFQSLERTGGDDVTSALGCAMALNNDVALVDGAYSGEPTELALAKAARNAGYVRDELETRWPRSAIVPFDSERKRMSTIHCDGAGTVVFVKGAPESVLPRCVRRFNAPSGEIFDTGALLARAERLASQGYRVLAFARRDDSEVDDVERDLDFLGLVALIDPPRQEAARSVADCVAAGIIPVMITGDHPGTALAIARRLGIADDDGRLITGERLAGLSDESFAAMVERVRVYARVSPEQKLKIVRALQARGELVAMTGDGVNDAPALKRANIGVAMGRKGTDVAREASDMVLLDDDFSTIVRAVREGRRIFDNIRKFIKYTMTSNSGEIWTLFLAPFVGLPIPLLPIHILWINLVTDGLPGLAFTAEPADPGVMRRSPRPPAESLFAHGMWQHILWAGLLIGGLSLASQAWALSREGGDWQTIVFTVLTFSQLFHSMAVRSETESLASVGIASNRPMLGALLVTLVLQLAVIYVPAFNPVFHTQPLPLFDLLVCIALSSLVLVAVEAEKWMVRRNLVYRS